MNKYRRVEVRAFRHRAIFVSGDLQPVRTLNGELNPAEEDGLLLSDVDLSEPIEPDSLEGQRILVEALHSIERRLTAETRARLHANDPSVVPKD